MIRTIGRKKYQIPMANGSRAEGSHALIRDTMTEGL